MPINARSSLAVLVVMLAANSVGLAPATAQPENGKLVAQGKAILTDQCARCHQIGPSGTSPLPVAPAFHELMERYPAEALEEALGEGLAAGHPNMPEFVFEPDDVGAIVAYFATLKKK